ncbi:LysR family transcriptional regulator [Sulfitobacter sp. TSTF-M16]|uniref:LysR family transcriptional regulator n=2 Tax=Sulfitobacter aestuariivivens TaxID=2766981 RepID=A0A927HGE1_9RHOB|nr:LysR substrate-binding domain-containing protein [Sulfitobacter aestuariivivens]MBD3665379.1 LysR family transcriptional regulator [Sulfitobacter aestuariivivens]
MDILLFRDLEKLRALGNFSQAAVLANLSQPAFSRRIKSLETWVGATLVDRSRQPVRLTEAGTQMLEAGLQALARIERERSQILEAHSLPDKYVVTFGAQHSIGWRFYPSWLQALEDAYGPILSGLRADDLHNCLRDLKNGELDFVVAYVGPAQQSDNSFDTVVIGSDELIPVCKPESDGTPLFDFTREGVDMPYLRFGEAAPISTLLNPMLKAHGLYRRLTTVYENSMAGALRIRARAGDGIAWLPRSLVAPDIDQGLLVLTGVPEWKVELQIRLYRNPANTNRVTRALWSFLEVREAVPLVQEG